MKCVPWNNYQLLRMLTFSQPESIALTACMPPAQREKKYLDRRFGRIVCGTVPGAMSLDYVDLELFGYVAGLKRPSNPQQGGYESSNRPQLLATEIKSKCGVWPQLSNSVFTLMAQPSTT